MRKTEEIEVLSQDAALLSVCEIGLGSLLHGFKIPLAGYFLSLNQVFFLSRTTYKTRIRTSGLTISAIASLFKSLSPAGKKLTPMLAIGAQGFLYSLGTLVFGPNPVGGALGGALSALWGFLQPLMIYYILFGRPLVDAVAYFYGKLRESIPTLFVDPGHIFWFVAGIVALKAMLASMLAVLAYILPDSAFQRWQEKVVKAARRSPKAASFEKRTATVKENMRQAWRELWNPLFILSLLLTLSFFFFLEASFVRMIWLGLRPVAVGFLLFFLIKYLPLPVLEKRMPVFASSLQKIRQYLSRD